MDVAIVGAGPAGLLVARRCAESGLDVHVFEEHSLIGEPTHCTGVISLEVAELVKIPDEIVLSRPSRALLHSPSRDTHEIAWTEDGREPILVVDRAAFDQGLADGAVEAGAVIHTATRVTDVTPSEDGVDLVAGGSPLRARACVIASGVSYRFQRRLGLGLPGQVVHAAQVELDARAADGVDLFFGRAVAPGGFAWMVPLTRDGRTRSKVGAMATGDAGAALERVLRRPEVECRVEGEPGHPVRRLMPLKPITQTYADRLLVVGDAGGFAKPTTGGGIFYSLLTASLASETLIEAFQRERLDAGFLAGYERRWKQRLGRELSVAAWLRDVVTKLTDGEIAVVLRALAGEDAQALIRGIARFNWHAEAILALARRKSLAHILLRALLR